MKSSSPNCHNAAESWNVPRTSSSKVSAGADKPAAVTKPTAVNLSPLRKLYPFLAILKSLTSNCSRKLGVLFGSVLLPIATVTIPTNESIADATFAQ